MSHSPDAVAFFNKDQQESFRTGREREFAVHELEFCLLEEVMVGKQQKSIYQALESPRSQNARDLMAALRLMIVKGARSILKNLLHFAMTVVVIAKATLRALFFGGGLQKVSCFW